MRKKVDNSDTRELIGFYKMGLDSILKGDYSIACYDGMDSSWADDGIYPSTEYIILIEKSGVVNYKMAIDSFFGITSFAPINDKLYLGCGNKIYRQIENTNVVLKNGTSNGASKKSEFELSNHIELPSYLDVLIYGDFFGAKYQPDYQRYEFNLDLTREELLIYLGTYFPRSFGESLSIFSSIIKIETINSQLNCKDCINILDIGSGSGGEILGLLHVLEDNMKNNIPINIYTFDGNLLVQDMLVELVSQFQKATNTKKRIQIYTNVKKIESKSDIEAIKEGISFISFDFILCNKICNELVSRGHITDAYLLMCNSFTSLLDSSGVLLILDVTTKDKNQSRFYSEMLNEQVNNFIIGHCKEYSTLLPVSCALHPECLNSCFTQHKFYISHSQKQNDISKVAYRILAGKALCDKFIIEIGSVKEIVNESTNNAKASAYCPLS